MCVCARSVCVCVFRASKTARAQETRKGELLEKLFGRMEDYIEAEFPSEKKARIKIVSALKTLIEIATRDDMAMHGKIKFLVDQVQDESASDAELKAWDRAFYPHKAKACGGEKEEWPWDESDT